MPRAELPTWPGTGAQREARARAVASTDPSQETSTPMNGAGAANEVMGIRVELDGVAVDA